MKNHLKNKREGFPWGHTEVTPSDDETGIRFSILKLQKGEKKTLESPMELACLQLSGEVFVQAGEKKARNKRSSLFDEPPFAVHAPKGEKVHIEALEDAELALFETKNEKSFPPRIFLPADTGNEHRGKGLVDNASLRYVRTIFDGSTSDPNTELVLGEVVNFPGRWSSYPPHHHPQPEIYHYRFTDRRGYGHAELGDEVLKVRSFDTVKILDSCDHSQCAAPGYGMYYIWVIRHLPETRYTVPEFTEEHRWTMDPDALYWCPKCEK